MSGYIGSTPVPQATQHREAFTATEGQTSFATAGYTPLFLDVYLNGSHLSPADFVATNGSDVVLVVAASADDICDIISYSPFEVNSQTFTGTTTTDVSLTTGVLTANGGAVFNEGSVDVDFRVESNGNANAIFVDGGGAAVGIGVVPEAWATYNPVLQVGSASTAVYQTDDLNILSNAYFIGGAWKFIANDTATRYQSAGGEHVWYNTASGSADAALTWVQQMKINTAGAVTMPLQPAFSAKVNSQINNLSIAGSSNTTIPFATEIFDQNADYNTNGTFTAPVTGKYSLSFFIRLESIDTATTSYDFAINTGNRNYTHRFDPDFGDSDTLYYHVNLTVLADMDASDTAHIEYYTDAGTAQTDIDGDSYFMGHLVC